MGKPTGFMEYERRAMPSRDPVVRLNDWFEIYDRADEHQLKEQGARCMDCGVAFCQSDSGCPIDNLIPEWNDLVYHGRWHDAYKRLIKTNNFPEFTGRICPAPCESACVLGITDPAVTIKSIECTIIDRAFEEGWVQPNMPDSRTGKKVAVIGSGPAGLAAADQLNSVGHHVTVFERDDRIGGLLTYGVPNMKLDKGIVQRRVDLLAEAGITFRTNANVGENVTMAELESYDAILLACGALKGRDLAKMPGRELDGIHLAMTYLTGVMKQLFKDGVVETGYEAEATASENEPLYLDMKDKNVIVIGGGDTGADCLGTALRQGCKSVLNITRREQPPIERDAYHPWPGPSDTYYLDYSHAEGARKFNRDPREYGILPLEFVDEKGDGHVTGIKVERLKWTQDDSGKWSSEQTGQIEVFPADYVFFAIGFTGHDTPKLVTDLGVEQDEWGSLVKAEYGKYRTSQDHVFVAGDMRRGASLIVWAIAEGRGAARAIDEHLMGHSHLPAPDVAGFVPSVG